MGDVILVDFDDGVFTGREPHASRKSNDSCIETSLVSTKSYRASLGLTLKSSGSHAGLDCWRDNALQWTCRYDTREECNTSNLHNLESWPGCTARTYGICKKGAEIMKQNLLVKGEIIVIINGTPEPIMKTIDFF